MNPISVGVWVYGMGTDRYVGDGYKEYMVLKDRIAHIGKLPGVTGIEITYPNDINEHNYLAFEPLLQENNLTIAAMGVELVCDKKWATGSLSSPKEDVRKEAISLIQSAMDFADSIGVSVVCLWLGQDGFDYLFQTDYTAAWNYLVEGLRICADHNPNIKLALEYKVSEPRLNCFANSAGKTLALCLCTGKDNVGVTVDIGHAFNAKENPAEVVSFLMNQNRLFHLHFNDNYLTVDDDMPVGSVHYLHFMELFYWLQKRNYTGWFSLDMYPYRDDPDEASLASIAFMKGMYHFVEKELPNLNPGELGKEKPSEILSYLFGKLFTER